MPNYDYYCSSCGCEQEILQKITDPVLTICPSCNQQTWKRKVGGGAGLHFKGSGFYLTDYQNSSSSEKPHKHDNCCPCGKPSSCSN
ncbi:FmdB family zinc ribbon protein [Candidatus Protochlamydia phocaeensis]|uniref:FmdB family zinc ribbon protein n=1 Tax=Candidatus Protochlamydia phocaeensis TaxID=1414722 RepID=UPI000838AF90|nr:FmdB family zinc ribbon protein [Candidatus Protochlamydia phocaeensis]